MKPLSKRARMWLRELVEFGLRVETMRTVLIHGVYETIRHVRRIGNGHIGLFPVDVLDECIEKGMVDGVAKVGVYRVTPAGRKAVE